MLLYFFLNIHYLIYDCIVVVGKISFFIDQLFMGNPTSVYYIVWLYIRQNMTINYRFSLCSNRSILKQNKLSQKLLFIKQKVILFTAKIVLYLFQIGWKYTNEWLAGNTLCKVLQVMRAFGLYLSSNVLVCISLDRYLNIITTCT